MCKTEEHTMDFVTVNLIGFVIIVPIAAIIFLPFILIWDYETFINSLDSFFNYFPFYFFGGIVLHELLHGITLAFFSPRGLKSIRFGIKWKYITPYCHCKDPIRVIHYKIGGAMPLIIMGIIPSVVGLLVGHGGILCFGIFFTWAAGGDIIALFMLRKFDNNSYVSDHPDKMGFIIEME
jgi:hypothetical protein